MCAHVHLCPSMFMHMRVQVHMDVRSHLPWVLFVCFFLTLIQGLSLELQGLQIELGHCPGSLGDVPAWSPTLTGRADMWPPCPAQYPLLSVIHYVSCRINPSAAEHLVYPLFGFCTIFELCFCLFFLNVCVPGSGIIGFLGSFWRIVLIVACQFICALLGFIIFAFLRQVFTLLAQAALEFSVAQAGSPFIIVLLQSSQCWD